MLAIAGQTGGPNWLNFLEETFFFLKIRNFEFLLVFLKIPRAKLGTSACKQYYPVQKTTLISGREI